MLKKISHVYLPSVMAFTDSASYFENLLAVNKDRSKPLSGRQISAKLQWPASYLVDLIKKRKPLTCQRASEFARFARLNNLELERLMCIALMETGDEYIRFFYQQKLGMTPAQVLLPNQSVVESSMYFAVDVVVGLLLHENQKLNAKEIQAKLNTKSLSLERIQEALNFILDKNILEWDLSFGGYIQKKTYYYDNFNEAEKKSFSSIEIHRSYAQNFIDFVESPQLPSAYISGIVTVTKEQFTPIALQLFQIRNWLMSISEENRKKEAADDFVEKSKLRLMQIDLNFFKVTK